MNIVLIAAYDGAIFPLAWAGALLKESIGRPAVKRTGQRRRAELAYFSAGPIRSMA
jgi:hypothetical protein